MKTYYSQNGEEYNEESEYDLAQYIWDDSEHKEGDIITIFEGQAHQPKASEFITDIEEQLLNGAYDMVGEHSESWIFSKSEAQALYDHVSEAVNEWCDKHDMQPSFFTILKDIKIKMRFIGNMGDSERVTEPEPPKS